MTMRLISPCRPLTSSQGAWPLPRRLCVTRARLVLLRRRRPRHRRSHPPLLAWARHLLWPRAVTTPPHRHFTPCIARRALRLRQPLRRHPSRMRLLLPTRQVQVTVRTLGAGSVAPSLHPHHPPPPPLPVRPLRTPLALLSLNGDMSGSSVPLRLQLQQPLLHTLWRLARIAEAWAPHRVHSCSHDRRLHLSAPVSAVRHLPPLHRSRRHRRDQ